METDFYKALDSKSNSIKIQEKRRLINKYLIRQLNNNVIKHEQNQNHVFLENSVHNLLFKSEPEKIPINHLKNKTNFWQPCMGFKIAD